MDGLTDKTERYSALRKRAFFRNDHLCFPDSCAQRSFGLPGANQNSSRGLLKNRLFQERLNIPVFRTDSVASLSVKFIFLVLNPTGISVSAVCLPLTEFSVLDKAGNGALVAEPADAVDSKSTGSNPVGVRISPEAPTVVFLKNQQRVCIEKRLSKAILNEFKPYFPSGTVTQTKTLNEGLYFIPIRFELFGLYRLCAWG